MQISQFSEEETKMFVKDFMSIIHLCRKVNENVWRDEAGLTHNLELIRRNSEAFSKKYRTLIIIVEKNEYYELKPTILLKDEHDFYNVFSIANRIAGEVDSVTLNLDGKYANVDSENFQRNFDKYKPYMKAGSVYFNLLTRKSPRSLHLRYCEKHGMIELVIDNLDFGISDPEFRLCEYYGLSFGYENSIILEDIESLFIGPVSSGFRESTGGGGPPY
ncbi:hypothetical protein JXB11_02205 [Candidatus Woesearchaeota archaeon]|nr:hypothetical protein [Candidatus Woesearchaeota archaeon]